MIKICVSGSKGKMGARIISLAKEDSEFNLSAEFDLGVDPQPLIKQCDCLIEFTNPLATIEHLALCEKYKKPMVIGTTGLSNDEKHKINQAARNIPIVFSPNMSLGVNLVFRLVQEAAQKLGQDYKVDIIETHHLQKKDAPSGTAKCLAELIKQGPGRKEEQIQIESIRQGEIVGEHQIRFNSSVDTIIIQHSAKTRDIFAQGALAAAKFVVKQRPGLYDMQDVIEGKQPLPRRDGSRREPSLG